MHPITYFYPEDHEAHSSPGHPERPKRLEAVKQALVENDLWALGPKLEPLDLQEDVFHAIHTSEHLERLKSLSLAGQDYDFETYLTEQSWSLALNAAGGAAALAQAVWCHEAATGFALSRPPGHHATPGQAMGFCLLNNIALAAENLIQNEGARRIAIIDIDVHHGNGTQDIFWKRDDVLFISTHQSPLYPGTGHLNERGAGDGLGYTCNIPLPPNTGDSAFHAAYDEIILPLLDDYQPEILLISFGFDAHWKDPLAQLQLSADGYAQQINKLLAWAQANSSGRIALFLEGGYDLEAGSACGLAVTQALLGQNWLDLIGPSPSIESDHWNSILDQAKSIWELQDD
jgi:acetoin utilization deacetylase AcuC-like enzyme